ncbi:MAG: GNAT family N-acetyltransferase [Ethanoligenens sp.]
MNIKLLSTEYLVKRIKTVNIPEVFALCKSNPLYYQHCPPSITIERIQKDLTALPKGKMLKDKYYLGFYKNKSLVAIMDLICRYPNEETTFIGFFMTDQQIQGRGVGTAIMTEACQHFKKSGSSFVRLGYVKGNPQSEAFWFKNHFEKTGVEVLAEGYVIVVMQRCL